MASKQITQTDIQAALDTFRRRGGLVKHLPDEIAPGRPSAGRRSGQQSVEAFIASIEPLN